MTIKQRILLKTGETLRFFRKKDGIDYKFPRIYYFSHDETVGCANQNAWMIGLNTKYLETNPELMIGEIIPHEVIHLIAGLMQSSRESYHGKTWSRFMREYGLIPRAVYEFN